MQKMSSPPCAVFIDESGVVEQMASLHFPRVNHLIIKIAKKDFVRNCNDRKKQQHETNGNFFTPISD